MNMNIQRETKFWFPNIKSFAENTWQRHVVGNHEIRRTGDAFIEELRRKKIYQIQDGKLAELAAMTWLNANNVQTNDFRDCLNENNSEKWWDIKINDTTTCDVKSTKTWRNNDAPAWHVRHYRNPNWHWPNIFMFLSFTPGTKYEWTLHGWMESSATANLPFERENNNCETRIVKPENLQNPESLLCMLGNLP